MGESVWALLLFIGCLATHIHLAQLLLDGGFQSASAVQLLRLSKETMHCLLEQMASLQERLAIQELCQRPRDAEIPCADSSVTTPHDVEPTPTLSQSEHPAQPSQMERLREEHVPRRRALKQQQRLARASAVEQCSSGPNLR